VDLMGRKLGDFIGSSTDFDIFLFDDYGLTQAGEIFEWVGMSFQVESWDVG
jgi:hypothetical protein